VDHAHCPAYSLTLIFVPVKIMVAFAGLEATGRDWTFSSVHRGYIASGSSLLRGFFASGYKVSKYKGSAGVTIPKKQGADPPKVLPQTCGFLLLKWRR
jgi:hypothetical protein